MRMDKVMAERSPYSMDVGTVYVTCGNGGAVQEPFEPPQPAWSAFRQDFKIGTVRVHVDPARGRLTLGEYWALDGSAIEEGIVLERKQSQSKAAAASKPADREPATVASASSNGSGPKADVLLPVTGGPGAATVIGTAAAAAATATRMYMNREPLDPDDHTR